MDKKLEERWKKLKGILTEIGAMGARMEGGPGDGPWLAVACSGGLDSRFLTHAALGLGLGVLALHFRGPHIQESEASAALSWLAEEGALFPGLRVLRAEVDPLALPEVRFNRPERCYHCKKEAFGRLVELAGPLPLCDGTTFSDLGEYRPGRRALAELGVRSPLAEAGLGKAEIRALARQLGLSRPEQSSQTCLLTRFDYGLEATPERLKALEKAEAEIAGVLAAHGKGAVPPAFRLRWLAGAQDQGGPAALPELHLEGGPGACAGPEPAPVRMPAPAEKPGRQEPALDQSRNGGQKQDAGSGLDADLEAALRKTLAGHGLAGVRIRRLERLSGFFDRKRQLQP